MLISALSAAAAGSASASIATMLPASRTKAAGTTCGLIESLPLRKCHGAHRRHHHLRDAITAPDLERIAAMVDEDHFDLTAIVGIDRPRRIEHRDAMLGRET